MYNPHRDIVREGKERMVEVGLDAIKRLASRDAEGSEEST